jgi:DNA repair ATPase RecN
MSSNLNERLKEKEDLFRETQVMLRRMQQILSQKKNELDPLEKAVSENPDDHDVQRRLYKAQVEVQESEVEVQEAKLQVQKAEIEVQEAKVQVQKAEVEALRNQPDRVEDFQEASRQLKTLRRLLDVYRGALAGFFFFFPHPLLYVSFY